MRGTTRKRIEAELETLTEDDVEGFMDALAEVDSTIIRLTRAETKAEGERTNFSAQVLELVRLAPSATVLLRGMTEARAPYVVDTAPYRAWNVAMARTRAALKRIAGSDDVAVWDKKFADVLVEANGAETFTSFERGTEEREGVTVTAKARMATLPPKPKTLANVDFGAWPEAEQHAYRAFAEASIEAIKSHAIPQTYADAAMSLVREGILAHLAQEPASVEPPVWLMEMGESAAEMVH